jgi:hypothetical protein
MEAGVEDLVKRNFELLGHPSFFEDRPEQVGTKQKKKRVGKTRRFVEEPMKPEIISLMREHPAFLSCVMVQSLRCIQKLWLGHRRKKTSKSDEADVKGLRGAAALCAMANSLHDGVSNIDASVSGQNVKQLRHKMSQLGAARSVTQESIKPPAYTPPGPLRPDARDLIEGDLLEGDSVPYLRSIVTMKLSEEQSKELPASEAYIPSIGLQGSKGHGPDLTPQVRGPVVDGGDNKPLTVQQKALNGMMYFFVGMATSARRGFAAQEDEEKMQRMVDELMTFLPVLSTLATGRLEMLFVELRNLAESSKLLGRTLEHQTEIHKLGDDMLLMLDVLSLLGMDFALYKKLDVDKKRVSIIVKHIRTLV